MSDDVLVLVWGPGNALELCRLTNGATPSLQTIGILELPPVLPYILLVAANFKTELQTSALDIHRQTRPPPGRSSNPSQDGLLPWAQW